MCSDHDATRRSSRHHEFFGGEVSSISIESGTGTIMLPSPKPLGPPVMCSDHDATRRSSRHDEFFGAGFVAHLDRIGYRHHYVAAAKTVGGPPHAQRPRRNTTQ